MDKKTLNNEIILCRPMVRKARVAVIRKILKKMKILKSCKNETMREKKLKKSDRLFEKVQIMKKVKDDDVTKFGLRNKDLDGFLRQGSGELKENALACLAKHEAVAKRIACIRDQIPNWEAHLPLLLDSLGKKKSAGKKEKIPAKEGHANVNSAKPEKLLLGEKRVSPSDESKVVRTKTIAKKAEHSKKDISKEASKAPLVEPQKKVEKVDDPFFIQKKVIAPRTVTEKPSEKLEKKRDRRDSASMFHMKPFKAKKDSNQLGPKIPFRPMQQEEKLHPSWAAKKVQVIKPFLGKKIKFSED